ncbi:hypothetical protein ACGFJ7_12815 [Actinoplanes sp. NPDC048988]|uniref:hypothetical protein n=1 Tax=Actinoplanes sp. NPDC048988 TaxID=3363901 RepID=UPI003721823F
MSRSTGKIAALVVAVVVVSGGGWLLLRPRGPGAAEVVARQVAALGGPAGWAQAGTPVTLLEARGKAYGPIVVNEETGRFAVSWTTTVTPASAGEVCGALADWTVRAVAHPAPAEVATACQDVVASPGEGGIFDSYGTEDRHVYSAFVDYDAAVETTLSVTFDYRPAVTSDG